MNKGSSKGELSTRVGKDSRNYNGQMKAIKDD